MIKSTLLLELAKTKFKTTPQFLLVLLFVLVITIFQDYLQSKYSSYAFYLSESFLFNLFWVLIFPVGMGLSYRFQKFSIFGSIRKVILERLIFIILASILHVLAYSLLLFGISKLFYSHTYGFVGNLKYTLSHDLYKYIFVYAGVSLFALRKNQSSTLSDLKTTYLDQLVIATGRSKLILEVDQILFIQASNPYIEIHTAGKKYLNSDTLKSILGKLNPDRFARIHKSTIVNLHQVVSYTSRLNGDYDVHLKSGEVLRLSRNYVGDLKIKRNFLSTA